MLLGPTRTSGVRGATVPRSPRSSTHRPSAGRISLSQLPPALQVQLASRPEVTAHFAATIYGSLDELGHNMAVQNALVTRAEDLERSYEAHRFRGASRSSMFHRVEAATASLEGPMAAAQLADPPPAVGSSRAAGEREPVWMRLSSPDTGFTAAFRRMRAAQQPQPQPQQPGASSGGGAVRSGTWGRVGAAGGAAASGRAAQQQRLKGQVQKHAGSGVGAVASRYMHPSPSPPPGSGITGTARTLAAGGVGSTQHTPRHVMFQTAPVGGANLFVRPVDDAAGAAARVSISTLQFGSPRVSHAGGAAAGPLGFMPPGVDTAAGHAILARLSAGQQSPLPAERWSLSAPALGQGGPAGADSGSRGFGSGNSACPADAADAQLPFWPPEHEGHEAVAVWQGEARAAGRSAGAASAAASRGLSHTISADTAMVPAFQGLEGTRVSNAPEAAFGEAAAAPVVGSWEGDDGGCDGAGTGALAAPQPGAFSTAAAKKTRSLQWRNFTQASSIGGASSTTTVSPETALRLGATGGGVEQMLAAGMAQRTSSHTSRSSQRSRTSRHSDDSDGDFDLAAAAAVKDSSGAGGAGGGGGQQQQQQQQQVVRLCRASMALVRHSEALLAEMGLDGAAGEQYGGSDSKDEEDDQEDFEAVAVAAAAPGQYHQAPAPAVTLPEEWWLTEPGTCLLPQPASPPHITTATAAAVLEPSPAGPSQPPHSGQRKSQSWQRQQQQRQQQPAMADGFGQWMATIRAMMSDLDTSMEQIRERIDECKGAATGDDDDSGGAAEEHPGDNSLTEAGAHSRSGSGGSSAAASRRVTLMAQHAALAQQRKSLALAARQLRRLTCRMSPPGLLPGAAAGEAGSEGGGSDEEGSAGAGGGEAGGGGGGGWLLGAARRLGPAGEAGGADDVLGGDAVERLQHGSPPAHASSQAAGAYAGGEAVGGGPMGAGSVWAAGDAEPSAGGGSTFWQQPIHSRGRTGGGLTAGPGLGAGAGAHHITWAAADPAAMSAADAVSVRAFGDSRSGSAGSSPAQLRREVSSTSASLGSGPHQAGRRQASRQQRHALDAAADGAPSPFTTSSSSGAGGGGGGGAAAAVIVIGSNRSTSSRSLQLGVTGCRPISRASSDAGNPHRCLYPGSSGAGGRSNRSRNAAAGSGSNSRSTSQRRRADPRDASGAGAGAGGSAGAAPNARCVGDDPRTVDDAGLRHPTYTLLTFGADEVLDPEGEDDECGTAVSHGAQGLRAGSVSSMLSVSRGSSRGRQQQQQQGGGGQGPLSKFDPTGVKRQLSRSHPALDPMAPLTPTPVQPTPPASASVHPPQLQPTDVAPADSSDIAAAKEQPLPAGPSAQPEQESAEGLRSGPSISSGNDGVAAAGALAGGSGADCEALLLPDAYTTGNANSSAWNARAAHAQAQAEVEAGPVTCTMQRVVRTRFARGSCGYSAPAGVEANGDISATTAGQEAAWAQSPGTSFDGSVRRAGSGVLARAAGGGMRVGTRLPQEEWASAPSSPLLRIGEASTAAAAATTITLEAAGTTLARAAGGDVTRGTGTLQQQSQHLGMSLLPGAAEARAEPAAPGQQLLPASASSPLLLSSSAPSSPLRPSAHGGTAHSDVHASGTIAGASTRVRGSRFGSRGAGGGGAGGGSACASPAAAEARSFRLNTPPGSPVHASLPAAAAGAGSGRASGSGGLVSALRGLHQGPGPLAAGSMSSAEQQGAEEQGAAGAEGGAAGASSAGVILVRGVRSCSSPMAARRVGWGAPAATAVPSSPPAQAAGSSPGGSSGSSPGGPLMVVTRLGGGAGGASPAVTATWFERSAGGGRGVGGGGRYTTMLMSTSSAAAVNGQPGRTAADRSGGGSSDPNTGVRPATATAAGSPVRQPRAGSLEHGGAGVAGVGAGPGAGTGALMPPSPSATGVGMGSSWDFGAWGWGGGSPSGSAAPPSPYVMDGGSRSVRLTSAPMAVGPRSSKV
ncbi:hypothetical protein HYH02_002840 [Chlamydomonas schloesseri]|uniref:Uncharacterized protein n=1 Tax=Chlamydomonas schloesseri TaxID=2026947 RepID=A0A836BAP3_9CHLO|nr:hypothetical protein HYH02_002840 [Chlamydomonas schloesseri]|eukprot:KAG2452603.1 hypothetical protein HYH02_002840 [Chlamydomonas schloesseri]